MVINKKGFEDILVSVEDTIAQTERKLDKETKKKSPKDEVVDALEAELDTLIQVRDNICDYISMKD